ncbi:hypothetical protein F441_14394, partial [Phytophthora nicotianae CJ01A1]
PTRTRPLSRPFTARRSAWELFDISYISLVLMGQYLQVLSALVTNSASMVVVRVVKTTSFLWQANTAGAQGQGSTSFSARQQWTSAVLRVDNYEFVESTLGISRNGVH